MDRSRDRENYSHSKVEQSFLYRLTELVDSAVRPWLISQGPVGGGEIVGKLLPRVLSFCQSSHLSIFCGKSAVLPGNVSAFPLFPNDAYRRWYHGSEIVRRGNLEKQTFPINTSHSAQNPPSTPLPNIIPYQFTMIIQCLRQWTTMCTKGLVRGSKNLSRFH